MYDRFFTEEEDAIEGFESDMKIVQTMKPMIYLNFPISSTP
jgi:hypothetical protein